MTILLHGFTETQRSTSEVSDLLKALQLNTAWLCRKRFQALVRAGGFDGEIISHEMLSEGAQSGRGLRPLSSTLEADSAKVLTVLMLLEREGLGGSIYERLSKVTGIYSAVSRFLGTRTDIDTFILSDAPHTAVTFVLWEEFGRRGLKRAVMRQGPLLHQKVFVKDADCYLYSELALGAAGTAHPATSAWLEKQEAETPGAEPTYMADQRVRAALRARAGRASRQLAHGEVTRFIRNAGLHLHRSGVRKKYESLASANSDMSDNCVFFLHLQPERTTVPDGQRFGDQSAAIACLRAVLPKHWGVLVREHPSTFMTSEQFVRSEAFYHTLMDLSGGSLLSLKESSGDILRRCGAVATVTGTIGLEAAVRGVPAGFFGSAPYAGCPGTTDLSLRLGDVWEPERSVAAPGERIDLIRSFLARFDNAKNAFVPEVEAAYENPREDPSYYKAVVSGLLAQVGVDCTL